MEHSKSRILFGSLILILTFTSSIVFAAVENVARKPGVSYTFTAGSGVDHSTDTGTFLIDGNVEHGGNTIVCFDFWGKTPEQSYIKVDMNLGTSYNLSKIKLSGKNLNINSYKVDRVKFEISSDDLNYQELATLPVQGGIGSTLWSIECPVGGRTSFQYVRITAWTPGAGWLNLTELEVYDFPAPENLVAERLSSSSVELTWDTLGEGFLYRIYRSNESQVELVSGNLIADDLNSAPYIDNTVDGQAYYYVVVPYIMGPDEETKNEGPPSETQEITAVATIRGTVTTDAGAPLADAKVFLDELDKSTTTDANGQFAFAIPPREAPLTLVIEKRGYYRAYSTVFAQAGQEENLVLILTKDETAGTLNLAQEPGVTYNVSTGKHFNIVSEDDGKKLIDGVLDNGTNVTVCYDFWHISPSDSYIAVDFDLKGNFPIKEISLYGKNHGSSYHIEKVSFYISQDNINFDLLGEVTDINQPSLWNASWDVGWRGARFVRVLAWALPSTASRLNIEEVEVIGLQQAGKVTSLTTKRIDATQVELSWQAQGSGVIYRVYRSTTPDVEIIQENLVADELRTPYFKDSIDFNRYYYKVVACIAVGEDRFPGEASDEATVGPVASLKGSVVGTTKEGEQVILDGCEITIDGYGITKYADEGKFEFAQIPAEVPLTIIAYFKGYRREKLEITLIPGQNKQWDINMVADITAPNPLISLSATADGPGLIKLSWETPEPHEEDQDLPSYYNIYRSDVDNFDISGNLLASGVTTLQYEDKDIIGGTVYYYAITTCDEAGNENKHDLVYASAKAISVPQVSPIGPKGDLPVVGDVEVKWTAVAENATYILEYSRNKTMENATTISGIAEPQYLLKNLPQGTWYWRVRAVFSNNVETEVTSIQSFQVMTIQEDSLDVRKLTIYPNPANPNREQIIFGYILDQPATVTISIFNSGGRPVKRIELGTLPSGAVHYQWDGLDTAGRMVNNGVYLVKIAATNAQVEPRQAEAKALLLINK
jgi:fibronectin type 3 domain-containing protein